MRSRRPRRASRGLDRLDTSGAQAGRLISQICDQFNALMRSGFLFQKEIDQAVLNWSDLQTKAAILAMILTAYFLP